MSDAPLDCVQQQRVGHRPNRVKSAAAGTAAAESTI
jgi:hypothetical protein